jgi:hypothetical protein
MPSAPRTLPPAEYLHQCFEYDAANGRLRWKQRPREHFTSLRGFMTWNANHAGRYAVENQRPKGHLTISLDFRHWQIGRVIYKMHHLVEPEFIDHRDRNPQNNRIENLRSATIQENNRNKFKATPLSGFTGVTRHGRKFRARIHDGSGKPTYIGSFDSAEDAHAAYREAANQLFGEFSPFRLPQS